MRSLTSYVLPSTLLPVPVPQSLSYFQSDVLTNSFDSISGDLLSTRLTVVRVNLGSIPHLPSHFCLFSPPLGAAGDSNCAADHWSTSRTFVNVLRCFFLNVLVIAPVIPLGSSTPGGEQIPIEVGGKRVPKLTTIDKWAALEYWNTANGASVPRLCGTTFHSVKSAQPR